MGALSSFTRFAIGSALGATVGAAVGLLLAPKSGEQLQAQTTAFADRLKTESDAARTQAEEAARERFRQKVNDSDAFRTE